MAGVKDGAGRCRREGEGGRGVGGEGRGEREYVCVREIPAPFSVSRECFLVP